MSSSCKCGYFDALDIKAKARRGLILVNAELYDYRNKTLREKQYVGGWMREADLMMIGDCAIFDDSRKAQCFYQSTRRRRIRVLKYKINDIIAYTRYE